MKLSTCFLAAISLSSIISYSQAPANNDCGSATLIITDSTCVTGTSRLTGTLNSATGDGGTIGTSCTPVASPDVWYKFVAKTTFPTITLSGLGGNWGTQLKLQLLLGTCGSFAVMACVNNGMTLTPALTNPLSPGTTYYIRVHKNTTSAPGASGWGFTICVTDELARGGRMKEVFSRSVISTQLSYPWEVTYGPDNNLWITESKGYKVFKMDPNTGVKQTVLDLASNSTFYSLAADIAFYCQFDPYVTNAQGGLAGLALHPNFLDGTANEKNWVYISYIRSSSSAALFTNRLARFTYNKTTHRLESPISLCDTLPGSNDHNSQRIIIAPVTVGGPKYLFYGSGDMGAGQGSSYNRARTIKSQFPNSYEGKILRFNLDVDLDAGTRDKWIPNDNPYNTMLGVQSAVWNIGQRNNQGFAYDSLKNILYGSSHGAYSDDEINIHLANRNYGHPLIGGYYWDGNYDGTTTPSTSTSISAGAPFPTNSGNSTCPPIGSEANRKIEIDGNGNGLYKDPLFSGYPGPLTGSLSVKTIWQTNPGNADWPSEGWSGLDLYTHTIIPGWKGSLIASGLKWGRLIKLKLDSDGDSVVHSGGKDTVTFFQSRNRYRDLAFAPNGKDIYIVTDSSSATSGPGTGNPIVPACAGCVIKYTFLGYGDSIGHSTISKFVPVTTGTNNTCNTATTVNIDGSNSMLWVPITGADGNIVAEINANGNSLGNVTTSFYQHEGAIRVKGGVRYANRNITITPQFQPTLPTGSPLVKVRFYLTKAEFETLDADAFGIPGNGQIAALRILKNNDACGAAVLTTTTSFTPVNAVRYTNIDVITPTIIDTLHYMFQANISSFSSFYFAANNIILPLDLITFTGSLENQTRTLLKWKTENETNTSHFIVERSIDGITFTAIGNVPATGNSANANYSFTDEDVENQQSAIVFYRLKMVDIDGAFKSSNIISVTLADITSNINVAPNPVTRDTKVTFVTPADGSVQYKLQDNAGRVIMTNFIQSKKGTLNTITINMQHYAAGAYYLNVTGAGINQNVKVQKL